jgi:hypothetical protein
VPRAESVHGRNPKRATRGTGMGRACHNVALPSHAWCLKTGGAKMEI